MSLTNIVTLEHERDILNICYAEGDRINKGFLIHLRETFHMLGLDVRLLHRDEVISDRRRLENAKVILCIISRTFSNGDLKSMFSNADISSKIVHISYGSYATDESIPEPLFKMEVDFERKELDKGEFRKMVNTVVQTLKRHKEIMEPAEVDFPVGLAERSRDIEIDIQDCMRMSGKSLRCFGLVGMGGAGKTTLAMSIYNKIHSKFEASCFSVNTRAEVQHKGMVAVQKKIVVNLLKIEDVTINDVAHGKVVLADKLSNVNALVILDDVDEKRHLDALYMPLQSSLGPKSLVIITTRDRKILESAQAIKIFDIEGLDKEMSKWLFYWHAFMRPKPPVELEEVSERVIEACNGLPLALTVVGSYLYNVSDKSSWEERLKYLQKNNREIFDVLRISFDRLHSEEQEAFLDICCFLIDEAEDLACAVLNACYGMGRTYLHELQNKCLITTYVDNWRKGVRRIRVHGQLRDMGRRIIREERRDRAWDEESANDILQDERARGKLRGLSVWSHIPLPVEEASHSGRLPCLRILVVKSNSASTEQRRPFCPEYFFNNVHCGDLRWLRWEGATFQELPPGLRSTKLEVVELQSLESTKPGSEIRELRMATLPKLQRLDLTSWRELMALHMTSLSSLQYLRLHKCPKLQTLDCKGFSSLQHLYLSECYSLRRIAGVAPSLQTLESWFTGVEELDFKAFSSLQHLIVYESGLKRIAGDAPSLQTLEVRDCRGLEELDCKGFLSLQHLQVDLCTNLRRIDGVPPSLQTLELGWCSKVEELHRTGLPTLPSLKVLKLLLCPVKTLRDLPATLQKLEIERCEELESVDVGGCTCLRSLVIRCCERLRESRISGLDRLRSDPSVRIDVSNDEFEPEFDNEGHFIPRPGMPLSVMLNMLNRRR